MKLSCINNQVHKQFEQSLRILQDCGYQSVEIHALEETPIEMIEQSEIDLISNLLKKYDMKVSSLASTMFLMTPLYDEDEISDFNPKFYKISGNHDHHMGAIKRACEIANQLETNIVRVFPFRAPDNRDIVGTHEDIKEMVTIFSEAAKVAQGYGVTLVVENCPYSYLPRGIMIYKLVKAVNHTHFKCLYDPGNSFRSDKSRIPEEYRRIEVLDECAMIADEVAHVHLKDYQYVEGLEKPNVHVPLLDGDVEIKGILSYLNEYKYDGFVSMEPEVKYSQAIESITKIKALASVF